MIRVLINSHQKSHIHKVSNFTSNTLDKYLIMIGSMKWVTLIYIYLKREIIHHLIKEFESPVIDWYTRITKETFCCFRNNSNCLHDQKPHSSFEILFHHPVTTYLPVVGRTDYCFLLVIQIQLCSAGMSFFIDRFLWLPV